MPFARFTKLIVKYILSQHNQISKRSLSIHHVIKVDTTLGNMKFTNKGTKDPIFGMAIPAMMLNDVIKAYVDSSKKKDEEQFVKTKPSGISIGGEARKESKEEGVDHSQKLKGLETLSEGEGSGITPEVLVEDVSSDVADATKKAAKAKKAETKKDTDEQFLNDNPEMTVNDVLKDLVKPEVQSWWIFNLPGEIDKFVKAHLKNVLPKDVPDFGKIKMEKAAKKSFPKHPTHKALYDSLIVSVSVDEDDMDKQLEDPPIHKNKRRDDKD
ncbi:ribonuclease H-like domain-containing protein [Tanacetum coccineum]